MQKENTPVAKPEPLPGLSSGHPRKSESHKPAPLSPIKPDENVVRPSDVNVEYKRTENRVFTTSTQRSTYSSESPAKSGPESQFRSNYGAKEVRTPTDFPDPRSPTARFSGVAEGTRTPTDFTDPRSPTTKFTKFDSNLQRSVVTKRTIIQNGEATTQVTESKSVVTHSEEGKGPSRFELSSMPNDSKAIVDMVDKLRLNEAQPDVKTQITESRDISEDGRTTTYTKTTEQSSASDDGQRSLFTKQTVSAVSTVNQTQVEPVSVHKNRIAFVA